MTNTNQPPSTNRALDAEAVSRVAHELRSPLTAVIGMLDVVLDQTMPLDNDETSTFLAMARAEADQMRHLIDNMLSYARLQRSTLRPSPTIIDLLPIIEQALARQQDVRRRTHVAIPAGVGALADPGLVLQILTNLIQNVDRYAPKGAVEIEVAATESLTSISVSDDGPGIPAESRLSVFEEHLGSQKGLGLGLALSRDLALSMSGDLILDEPRRSGSTFTLTLPTATFDTAIQDQDQPGREKATSPRARLLMDVAAALSESSLDESVAGLHRIYSSILSATNALLLIPDGTGQFRGLGSFGATRSITIHASDPILTEVVTKRRPVSKRSISDHQVWAKALEADAAIVIPVLRNGDITAILALGWVDEQLMPNVGSKIAEALGTIAGVAIERWSLAEEVAFERSLRASVMESLPIAISVFVGDPPTLTYLNQRERDMLGLEKDEDRPRALAESQELFQVSFANGIPLTLENSPVVESIRSGKSAGPFYLRVGRLDGSTTLTRTYCSPFLDSAGNVAGAVVTSEEVADGEVELPGQESLDIVL